MGVFKKKTTERPSRSKKKQDNGDLDAEDGKPKKGKRSTSPKEKKEKKSSRGKSPKSEKKPRKKSPKSPKTRKPSKQKKESIVHGVSVVHPSVDAGIRYPPLYFRDGARRVDFILVTTKKVVGNADSVKLLNAFADNLKSRSVFYEFENGKLMTNLIFIKINVSDGNIVKLASEFHINLTYTNPNYNRDKRIKMKFLQNYLNSPFLDNPIFNRSSSVAGDRPSGVTDAERSMIAYKVLAETPYGNLSNEFGYAALINKGIIIEAYPLHDPTYRWTTDGPLSDRQLLRKYWANYWHIFKVQPLNLVEKYFGTDNAFYFAWVGFYIKMLTLASILGILFFIIGAVYYTLSAYNDTENEVCKAKLVLCPACNNLDVCKFTRLEQSCDLTLASNFFDNDITIIFAIIMSLWATLFLAYWKRYEGRLSFRWNVRHLTVDTSIRYEYLEAATKQKTLPNGEPYVFVPKAKKYFHIILTYSTCVFLVVLVVAIIFGYILYRVGIRYSIYISKMEDFKKNTSIISSATGAVFIYCFIGIFGKIYETVALILTRYEYHRTELEHDNSYVYKMAALSFANNYAAITYLAFFKGSFYTHPGKNGDLHIMFGLGEDICDPAGCLIDLTIQLACILIARCIISTGNQFVVPYLKYKFNKLRYHRKKNICAPQWEEEFVLSRTSKYYLIYEWTSMLVQYGFVTFYVAALPIAPLIAWLNNIIELRIDAIKMVTTTKRPVAHRTSGIGPYKGILKGMTIAGIATNAFLLAFTTDFIPRFMYAVSNNTGPYRKIKYSRYALSDFPNYTPSGVTEGQTECFYPGHRHPPGHEKQYTLNEEYWKILAARFAFVLIFEHVMVTFTGILAYIIPKQTLSVLIESNKQEIAVRQAKNKILNEEREKSKKHRKSYFRKKSKK